MNCPKIYVEKKFENMLLEERKRQEISNLDDVQLHALCYVEDGEKLPVWLNKKVVDFLENFGRATMLDTYTKIVAKLACDSPFCVQFRKEARKQRFDEKTQINYLGLEKLPDIGDNTVRLKGGDLIIGKADRIGVKAIDGYDEIHNKYVFLKYTTEISGGNQGNVEREAYEFASEAINYINKHDDAISFAMVLDGEYFSKHMSPLKKAFVSDRLFIGTSDEYKEKFVK